MEEKLKTLIEGKWSDKYLCKLALFDHIRECLEKDNFLKATDEEKWSIWYENLDKELMDLKIILDFYFKNEEKLYQKRVDKFLNNLNK